MSELDRNPSPPPEILNDENLLPDRIGDTVYSKQWIIKTMMKLVRTCDKMKEDSSENVENFNSSDSNNVEESSNNGCSIVELDPKLEEDACALWDMTVSQDVAKYLIDSDFCGIFQDIIDKTQSPRLLEIIIGILGNISTFDTLCSNLLKNKSLVLQILLLSGTTDTPSLIQVFRFVVNGLKNQNHKALFDAFEENTFFMENVKYILSNSLSSPVILATFDLLINIFMQNISYTSIWGEDQYLESVLVAGKQLLKNKDCIDEFFRVFNSLCQCSCNVEKFIKKWNDIKPFFIEYINNLEKEECLFDTTRAVPVQSYFDAYNTLLNTGQMEKTCILSDLSFLTSVAKISQAVHVLISNVKKNNKTTESQQQPETKEQRYFLRHVEEQNGIESTTMLSHNEFDDWNVLAETIIDLAKTLQNFVDKEEEKKVINDILNSSVSEQNCDSLIV